MLVKKIRNSSSNHTFARQQLKVVEWFENSLNDIFKLFALHGYILPENNDMTNLKLVRCVDGVTVTMRELLQLYPRDIPTGKFFRSTLMRLHDCFLKMSQMGYVRLDNNYTSNMHFVGLREL